MDAVGLFRPYDQKTPAKAPAAEPEPVAAAAASTATASKNRPTPTRQQAQAARMDALHPKLTKRQAAAQDRAADDKKRQAQMEAVDNQPERVLLRNYVDSRISLVQFILPIMLVALACTWVFARLPVGTYVLTIVLWVIMFACVVTCWWFWRGYKAELAARYPRASSKGLMMTLVTRMMMIPQWRQPKPVIKRGDAY